MKFTGVIPALVTPVTTEGKLNVAALEKLVEGLLAEGADGFYVGGATGEGVILDVDVHKELTKEVVRITNGRCPIIVHVARMNNREMIELAKYAQEQGVDAISAIPPLFYRYGDDGIYNYYKKLADSVDLPVIIYNNPNTGVAFTQDMLARLFSIKNITGIKWTNFDFAAVMQLKSRFPEINVISGPDELMLQGLTAGCDAAIGTTYNFMLPLAKRVYHAFQNGDMKSAIADQTRMAVIIEALLSQQGIMATRVILKHQGYEGCEIPHFPMVPLTEEQETDLLCKLRTAGLEI